MKIFTIEIQRIENWMLVPFFNPPTILCVIQVSRNWSNSSLNEFDLVFTQMNHRIVFVVKLQLKSFETWPMSVCIVYAGISVWLQNDRVNKFFEIRWWNLLRFVCIFSICIHNCATILSIGLYIPTHLSVNFVAYDLFAMNQVL